MFEYGRFAKKSATIVMKDKNGSIIMSKIFTLMYAIGFIVEKIQLKKPKKLTTDRVGTTEIFAKIEYGENELK